MEPLFNTDEYNLIKNEEFIAVKRSAISKVEDLFAEIENTITQSPEFQTFAKNSILKFQAPKISKGENYKGLPYVVLDHPKLFSKTSKFSFRTLFWWGNFFSNTLHLEGKALEFFRPNILANQEKLRNMELYICVNSSPWEYHYLPDNYRLINEISKEDFEELIRTSPFIKLSKQYAFSEGGKLPDLSKSFLLSLLKVIS